MIIRDPCIRLTARLVVIWSFQLNCSHAELMVENLKIYWYFLSFLNTEKVNVVNTLRPRQISHYFTDDIFKCVNFTLDFTEVCS